jgi:peptidoglycan hydrolase CwlO-like protein
LLVDLLSKQKRVEKALARTLKSLSSLETYLSSLKAEHLQVTKLQEVVEQYDSTAGDLDEKVTELEQELKETEEAIKEERKRLAGPTGDEKLNLKATIGVFADSEGDIKIALIYGT